MKMIDYFLLSCNCCSSKHLEHSVELVVILRVIWMTTALEQVVRYVYFISAIWCSSDSDKAIGINHKSYVLFAC